jgi:hypothetical protein
MNVEIGAEAALFPEKEYINGIAVAVQSPLLTNFTPPSPLFQPRSENIIRLVGCSSTETIKK